MSVNSAKTLKTELKGNIQERNVQTMEESFPTCRDNG
jgi:hypothetical protein